MCQFKIRPKQTFEWTSWLATGVLCLIIPNWTFASSPPGIATSLAKPTPSVMELTVIGSDHHRIASVDEDSVHLDSVHLQSIRHAKKRPDFGGETCIALYLQSLGHQVTGDDVFDASRVDPIHGRGCHASELNRAAKRLGFQTGDVWLNASTQTAVDAVWKIILTDLKTGTPSVVCRINNGAEEFVLVIGHDATTDEVIFHDPNQVRGASLRKPRPQFLADCRLAKPSATTSGEAQIVCIGLKSTRLKITPGVGFTDADFAQHIRDLKTRLPHDDFKIVLQKPFVVVGDGSMAQVKRSATGTVKWAVDSIKQDFFQKDPIHIIDVWLFKNPESYRKHNLELFDSNPGTPYGYYSSANRVLVMDISTGGGTLVHEIVHPFIESNFARCPSWFNEGLASLYEQSASRNGHIVGLTNWRLRGLQLTIQDDRLPSFKELCSTTTREFYDGASTNYAQARYLNYYLQERGKLIEFYQEFTKNCKQDPTGYETLQKVLGRQDMDKFQDQWEQYVLKLRFGN
ncbi:MAG: hypothetical protein ACI814_002812 [Mariniblastus sp.]|jgi:hypothetical protein